MIKAYFVEPKKEEKKSSKPQDIPAGCCEVKEDFNLDRVHFKKGERYQPQGKQKTVYNEAGKTHFPIKGATDYSDKFEWGTKQFGNKNNHEQQQKEFLEGKSEEGNTGDGQRCPTPPDQTKH